MTSTTTGKLALAGGEPITGTPLNAPAWPPTSDETERDLVEIYRSRNWSFNGPNEVAFAQEYAAAHDAKYGIFMANGTVTLQCALGVHGIGPGDEVIIPALTWPATAMAVIYLGATPVFVDIERDTLCIDPKAVEAAITPRTRAIIPVHLYGSIADLDALGEIASKHNLVIIEDCAHAQGGRWNGRGVGSIGSVGSFSFQQSKTMAAGEGGICLTNDDTLADKIYRMKHIGYGDGARQGSYSTSPPEGMLVHNFRATEFQAAILRHQLRNLDELIALYNRNAIRIAERLSDVPGIHVQSRGRLVDRQSYYALAFSFADAPLADVSLSTITEALGAEGLSMLGGTYGVVYKHILFNMPQSSYRIANGKCPIAEDIGSARTLVLPHPWLGADDSVIDTIADGLAKITNNADALRAHAGGASVQAPEGSLTE